MPGIEVHVGRRGPELGRERDVFAQESPQHLLGIGHHAFQAQHLRFQHLLAAECEKLARERGGALAGGLDLHCEVPELAVLGQIEEHQLDVAGDHRQQVVEVVGHAAGEQPDGLHLLGLP